jgi:tetratricopeptide (TPR) repeat protein
MVALLVVLLATAASQGDDRGAAAMHRRAMALEAAGDHAAALPLLWEAAAAAPRDADIQNHLGDALVRVGALDAAIDAYRAALAARPRFGAAANNLILALVAAGRSAEAVAIARRSVDSSPADAQAHFALGLALSELDVDMAIASFRHALDLQPRHTLARYNLALVLKRADRLDDAVRELRRVVEADARPEAHYSLGAIYAQQGDLERAAASLEAAVRAAPTYAEAHHLLGSVRLARRELAAADDALRRALALQPALAAAHDTLSRVLQAKGDAAGAERHRNDAERLRARTQLEQQARVWTSVGTEKLEGGDPAAALDCFLRATATDGSYAPAHYQMGRALLRLAKIADARAAFARAQSLNPALVPPPIGSGKPVK